MYTSFSERCAHYKRILISAKYHVPGLPPCMNSPLAKLSFYKKPVAIENKSTFLRNKHVPTEIEGPYRLGTPVGSYRVTYITSLCTLLKY